MFLLTLYIQFFAYKHNCIFHNLLVHVFKIDVSESFSLSSVSNNRDQKFKNYNNKRILHIVRNT